LDPIESFGSEEQKMKYLPKLASGEWIGCFGLTETDGGSDPGAMRTTAVAAPGGYILNGSKMWITNSPVADVAVVWAKLDGSPHLKLKGSSHYVRLSQVNWLLMIVLCRLRI